MEFLLFTSDVIRFLNYWLLTNFFQNISQLNINTWIFTILFYHLTNNFMKNFMLCESDVSLKTRVL